MFVKITAKSPANLIFCLNTKSTSCLFHLIFQVKYEGQTQYLTSVCMGCLEGVSSDRVIRCR